MIHPLLRRLARDRRGAAAVEFAAISIPMILAVFGTIEFGRLQYTRNALQQTVIEGARCMGLKATPCATAGIYDSTKTFTHVRAVARGWSVGVVNAEIAANAGATCSGIANFSQVTISYEFSSVVAALLGNGNALPLTAVACFPNQA